MAKRGRKPFLEVDPNLYQQIMDALATGVSIRDVCAYVGITEDTYHVWCRNNPEFFNATMRARVTGRMGAAAVIRRSALGDPKNGVPANPEDAKWYLERTDPSNWGRKDMLISLGLDAGLLKRIKSLAESNGMSMGDLFEDLANELALAANSPAYDSEKSETAS